MRKGITLLWFFLSTTLGIFAQVVYHDASSFPLIGKISEKTETRYERLPAHLKEKSRPRIWELGKNTAGLAIRFRTNSSSISVRWNLLADVKMSHMTLVGIKGVDLYSLTESNEWRFVNSGKPAGLKNETQIIANMTKVEREYMLYLPLYDGVTHMEIGIDSCASITQPQVVSPKMTEAIVYYGTSIAQGGCASRPGMAHTNILSRQLDRPIINLGFSGNAFLDYEIAETMASYPAPLYIIDCLPNVNAQLVDEKLENFYRILRKSRPNTPILLIENPMFPFAEFDQYIRKAIIKKNDALRKVYEKLKSEGDEQLYFLSSEAIIGFDGEATVDGIHFTDLGFMRYADILKPVIQQILSQAVRIVAIGNSFSADAMEYLDNIAASMNKKLISGNILLGGCSLEMHVNNYNENKPIYKYRKNLDCTDTDYRDMPMSVALKDEKWDYVVIQQVSHCQGKTNSYYPYIQQLVDIVNTEVSDSDFELFFHQTWAYPHHSKHEGFKYYNNDQQIMMDSIISVVKKVCKKEKIKNIFPSGVAIQNARNTSLGDNLNRDNFHLNTLGQYVAACTWFETLFHISANEITWKPEGITEEQAILAREAAHYAVRHPFKTTRVKR